MQKILGDMRRAIQSYNMIKDGDVVAVGVSGGKDSVIMLTALVKLRRFININYTVKALTLDPCFGRVNTDYQKITEFCNELGVKHYIKRTEIGEVVFDIRKESNPCSLCARMRRGALHDFAKEHGCNIIALGHHKDDALETFVMNLFNEGRIGCFSPVTYMSRKDVTVIRPLLLTDEKEIRHIVKKFDIPIVKSVCPADGFSQRQWTKDWLKNMDKEHPGLKKRLYGAMVRGNVSGW